jgi:hypothetical protein
VNKTLLKQAAKNELERRKKSGVSVISKLMSTLTTHQRSFVEDPNRFKIARCGRQAGKTYADAVYLIKTCQEHPNSPTLYLGLTRDSAKAAIWTTLITILQTMNIEHEALPSSLIIRFRNGSFIQLFGADAPNARNRIRGRKFKLVIVDEMGFFLKGDELVQSLLPTLAILNGTIAMTSSPGELLSGFFYEADQGKDREQWSRFHWTLVDNPEMQKPARNPKFKTRGEEELDMIVRVRYGGNRMHPGFRREYLGEWVADSSSLVYPYTQQANILNSEYPMDEEEYALGVDFGSVSANAIVVMKYSPYSRTVQIVDVWTEGGLLVDQIAAILKTYIDKYKPTIVVVDSGGLGKVIEQELNRRYHMHVQAAEKTEKSWYQRIMQNDLMSGYIKVIAGLPILSEWDKITKDSNGDEIRGPSNHCADAALYVYRRIYNTFLKTIEEKPTTEQLMIRQIEQQAIRDKMEDDFDKMYGDEL